jgi:hypothetical protein
MADTHVEEPDADPALRVLGDVHAAARGRKAGPVAGRRRRGDGAARVGVRLEVAVGRVDQGRGLHGVDLRAARVGMERHLVHGHAVDALERVDLAAGRPARRGRPEAGPDRTLTEVKVFVSEMKKN